MEVQLNSELNLVNVTAFVFIYSLFVLIVLKYLSIYILFILLLTIVVRIHLLSKVAIK